MKSIFKAILLAVSLTSCNVAEKNIAEKKSVDYNNGSLIGKTTEEINNLGWFSCKGSVIDNNEGDRTKFWLTKVATTPKGCNTGQGKILLQKEIGRNGNMAIFETLDEINIVSKASNIFFDWTNCTLSNTAEEEFFIVHYKDQRQAELTEIYDIWSLDLKNGKFGKVVLSKDVVCINSDFNEIIIDPIDSIEPENLLLNNKINYNTTKSQIIDAMGNPTSVSSEYREMEEQNVEKLEYSGAAYYVKDGKMSDFELINSAHSLKLNNTLLKTGNNISTLQNAFPNSFSNRGSDVLSINISPGDDRFIVVHFNSSNVITKIEQRVY